MHVGRQVQNRKRFVFFVVCQTVYADGGVVLLEHPYLLRFEWELQAAAVDRILMPDVTVETIGIVPDRK